MKYTKRFKGWLWKIILLAVLVYVFKNYSQIKEWPLFEKLSQSQVLGEQTLSSQEKLVDSFQRLVAPVQEKVAEGRHYVIQKTSLTENDVRKDDSPEKVIKNNNNNNKGDGDGDYRPDLDEFLKNIEKLPQKQAIKIKEYLIKEIFPECQCDCTYDD